MKFPRQVQRVCAITVFSTISLLHTGLYAQQDPPPAKWHVRAEPYVFFPSMKGQVKVGVLPTIDIDRSFSDILEQLKFAGMLNLEVYNDKWRFMSDLLYMNLRKDVQTNPGIASGSLTTRQLGWELAAFRRITPWFEAGIGTLVNNVNMTGTVNVRVPQVGTRSETIDRRHGWVDPLIVTRFSTPDNKPWYAIARADIGGFGIGSKLAWQLMGMAGYRFGKTVDASLGYRIISLDYETDKDRGFRYDMRIAGPMVRVGFTF